MYKVYKTIKYKTSDDVEVVINSQLYKVGIYIIVNNDPGQQYNLRPENYSKIVTNLKNDNEKGKIKDLKLIGETKVTINDDEMLEWGINKVCE